MRFPFLPWLRSQCAPRTDALTVAYSMVLHRTTRRIQLAIPMTLSILVSGCAVIEIFEPAPDAVKAEPSAAVPAPGTVVEIHDAATGELLTVSFGRNYMAASGRRCAYYFEPGTDAVARKRPSGIVCQAGAGGWTRIPSRIPVTPGP